MCRATDAVLASTDTAVLANRDHSKQPFFEIKPEHIYRGQTIDINCYLGPELRSGSIFRNGSKSIGCKCLKNIIYFKLFNQSITNFQVQKTITVLDIRKSVVIQLSPFRSGTMEFTNVLP